MSSKKSRRDFLAAAVITAVASGALLQSPAEARRGGGGGGTTRKTVPLKPTTAGTQLTLKGRARIEVRADRNREKVNVEVESHTLTAGQSVDVYAVNPANSPTPVKLGTITLRSNPRRRGEVQGELELKNYDGQSLPDGVSPVAGISEFRVTAAGSPDTVLLTSGVGTGGGDDDGGNGGGGGDTRPLRRRIALTPTSAGAAARVSGKSETETDANGRQKFKIEVESRSLPVGTTLEVRFTHAANAGGPFTAGSLTLTARREAEVEFKNYDGRTLPTGASPVNGITSVSVFTQAGELLATGAF